MPQREADPCERGPIREPPRTALGVLSHLGPSMILSASIVGSGELIMTTTLGFDASCACACCGTAFNLAKDAPLETAERDDLLGGITLITSPSRPEFEAIPYCVWNNRGPSSMAVWLSERSDSKPMIDPATAKLYEQYGQPLSRIAATASTNYSEAYNAPKAIDACRLG